MSSYWYNKDGIQVTEIECKTKPGVMRPLTVRDAKKFGLIPPVHRVLSVLHNEGLEIWKRDQLLDSALTLPVIEGETMDERKKRIIEDANAQSEKAKEKGTIIHGLAERYVKQVLINLQPYPQDIIDIAMPLCKWVDEHKFRGETEKVLTGRWGGKLDFKGRNVFSRQCIADWKTQATTPGKPFNFYDEWIMQLAAYSELADEDNELISIAISTTEPGRIEAYTWTQAEHIRGLNMFLKCFDLYQLKNKWSIPCLTSTK